MLKIVDLQFSKDITSKNCVIFCGVGISMIPPSKLPSGVELKNKILEIITGKKFKKSFKRVKSNRKHQSIVPEIIFQILFDVCGNKTFIFF